MPQDFSATASTRDLAAIFAAHLARLLNTPHAAAAGTVVVDPYAVEERLLRTLAGSEERARPVPHGLLGYGLVAADRTPHEVARRWLQQVLDRRLRLARAGHLHKGHELLGALCRRGLDPQWAGTVLARRTTADLAKAEPVAAPDPAFARSFAPDFAAVAERLGRIDGTISQGNPAASTRERSGPLRLMAGGAVADVPEELSVWQAITSGPAQLRVLAEGPDFNAFCSIMIKAVETANAPYGAFIAVGLSPFDWDEVIGVNTAKKLGAFLKAVRGDEPDPARARGTLAGWRQHWQRRPVPGYASADELWNSELGRALRFPRVALRVDRLEAEAMPEDATFQKFAAFEARMQQCRADGVIDVVDEWLLLQLYIGRSLAELAATPRLRVRIAAQPGRVDEYVALLEARLVAHALAHNKAAGGRRGNHPDNDDNEDD
jgi:hypothetical protein